MSSENTAVKEVAFSPPISEKIGNRRPFRSATKKQKTPTKESEVDDSPAKGKTPKSKTPKSKNKKTPTKSRTPAKTPPLKTPPNKQCEAPECGETRSQEKERVTLADLGASPESCVSYETMNASFDLDTMATTAGSSAAKKSRIRKLMKKKKSPVKGEATKVKAFKLSVSRRLSITANSTGHIATNSATKKPASAPTPARRSTLLESTQASCTKQRPKSAQEAAAASAAAAAAAASKVDTTRSITVPVTPKLTKKQFRETVAPKPLSSEELELKKIDDERKRLADELHRNRQLYMKVKKTAGVAKPAMPSVKKLTVPTTPKMHAMKKKAAAAKKSPLHRKKASPVKSVPVTYTGPKPPTIPEPFKFAQSKSQTARPAAPTPRNLSAAELAEKFFVSGRTSAVPPSAAKTNPDGTYVAKPLTIAESPKFHKVQKNKPAMPSTSDLEAAEMEHIKQHPFKARQLDRRIFESAGELGVPKVAARQATEPEEFHWAAGRASTAAAEAAQWEASQQKLHHPKTPPQSAFKARPMPVFTPAELTGATPVQQKPLTVALSPNMSGGHRASSAPARRQKPHHSVVEQQRLAAVEEYRQRRMSASNSGRLELTEPKEFSFRTSQRGEHYQAKLQQQLELEQQRAAAAREVHALPLPPPSTPSHAAAAAPPATPKPTTVPQPFSLRSSAKHEHILSQKQQQLQLEAQRVKEAQQFHARPVPKTTYEAEKVVVEREKDENASVEAPPATPVVLQSDLRAAKRREFDEHAAAQRKAADAEKLQRALQEMQNEQREVASLRRKSVAEGGMVFKAQPVQTTDAYNHYSSGHAPEPKPLTEPKSPYLQTKQRMGTRAKFGGGGFTADHNQALFTQALNNM